MRVILIITKKKKDVFDENTCGNEFHRLKSAKDHMGTDIQVEQKIKNLVLGEKKEF